MDYEENNVDTETGMGEAATADDMLSDDEVIEEVEEPAETLDSLTGEEEEAQSDDDAQPQTQGTSEPGYVQKRIDKALAREKENMRADIMAEVEARYAPIMERLLEMDAQELVRKGEVKNIELAKELLRYRQGQPAQQAPVREEQPRNENGQYAPKGDPVTEAKIDILANQVEKIREKTGLDVMDLFNSDKSIKDKVISGEMDFYDVAELMKNQPASQKRRPPAPTRSSNGASGQTPNAIENMTKEQFARMEKKIAEGARYTLR